jgi:hypothetical protein
MQDILIDEKVVPKKSGLYSHDEFPYHSFVIGS